MATEYMHQVFIVSFIGHIRMGKPNVLIKLKTLVMVYALECKINIGPIKLSGPFGLTNTFSQFLFISNFLKLVKIQIANFVKH